MYTIGKFLKKHREAAGLTIQDVAQKLYLRTALVEAIEQEDFDKFKSPSVLRGHVKNYARIIGADVNTALAILRRQLGEQAPKLEKIDTPIKSESFQITPLHVFIGVLTIITFILIGYLIKSYMKTLRYPTLVIESPKQKTVMTADPQFTIQGVVEKDSILTINGHNINYDDNGKFSYDLSLNEGENIVEVIAKRKYDNTKRVIKKFLIIYNKDQNQESVSNTNTSGQNTIKPLKFTIKVKSSEAWLQVVVDNVQKVVGIKPAGYSKTFEIKNNVYAITGRPAITEVYVNGQKINWITEDKTFKVICKLENRIWLCNNNKIE